MTYDRKVECRICGRKLDQIHLSHLETHGLAFEQYKKQFPEAPTISEVMRAKLSEAKSGKNHLLWGKKYTEEEKEKQSEALKKTLARPEVRKKYSKAKKGKKHPFYGKNHSKESRKRMSEVKKGKKHSIAARRKMSESRTGRKFSKETRKKMSEAQTKAIAEGRRDISHHYFKSGFRTDLNCFFRSR
ncbi:MAG: NUMOD3 domain-containing DNA-binding protein [Candidatus Hodarchaeota archaeon]